jgi:zinc/manganese transport system substrate-binding protein
MNRIIGFVLMFFLAPPALAALDVFACEPEWGALVPELGGDKANVYTATTAQQNPHYIEARPSLLAKARRADLVICTGADMEAGWLPVVLSQSGNAKIQPGSPGFFEAASVVDKLEVPRQLDRAMGDVHASGNPHVHLDPHNVSIIAAKLTERLAQLDAANAAFYIERGRTFQDKWRGAISQWERDAVPLKGLQLVTYHKDFSYLIAWLGMREVANLEPKPGIPPTASHLAELLAKLKSDPADAIVHSTYSDPKPAAWLAERAGIPAVVLPFTVGGSDSAKDLYGLFSDTIERLLAVQARAK